MRIHLVGGRVGVRAGTATSRQRGSDKLPRPIPDQRERRPEGGVGPARLGGVVGFVHADLADGLLEGSAMSGRLTVEEMVDLLK
mgnify:CR=1 FL=1